MNRRNTIPVLAAMAFATVDAHAQTANTLYEEQGNLIRAPQAVTSLGADLFGDKVNLYTGTAEFVQTDFSLPGNNSLPVSVGRRFVAGNQPHGKGHFGQWDLEIPHIHGIYSASYGWYNQGLSGSQYGARCSIFGPPPWVAVNGVDWDAGEYWQGHMLYVPGQGDQELIERVPANGFAPGGNTTSYPVVTANLWSISCLPSLANDSSPSKTMGEGFLAVAPDGTQYRFDWMVARTADSLTKGTTSALTTTTYATTTTTTTEKGNGPSSNSGIGGGTGGGKGHAKGSDVVPNASTTSILQRQEIWFLPTTVTDRFGNTVIYTYDTNNPWNLTTIQSSDGRRIDFTYLTVPDGAGGTKVSNLVSSATDGTRTWQYSYANFNADGTLAYNVTVDTVTLPDASQWKLAGIAGLSFKPEYQVNPSCYTTGTPKTDVRTGTMTHPSGATGTFTMRPTIHGRSYVPAQCLGDANAFPTQPDAFVTQSLVTKSIGGPGLPTMSWNYVYGAPNASFEDECTSTACAVIKTVEVTDPKGDLTRYTFGNRFDVSEGHLQLAETYSGTSTLLRSQSTAYHDPASGPYPNPMGQSPQDRGDSHMNARLLPAENVTTTQQGATFSWVANAFDTKARPTSVTKSSSLGYARTEITAYADNTTKWVLGQTDSVTESGSGDVMVKNTYDATTAALLSTSRFGKLQQSMTYFADGTVNTRADGKGNTTTFSNYKRGIAQNVSYADTTAESAAVNNIGLITSVTDAAGFTTGYQYDALGRLARIVRPAGDPVAWNDTVLSFTPVGSAEVGLPSGHWKQTVTTGSATTVTYMDGLWRPVFMQTYDANNINGTSKAIVRGYDHNGRTTFESYAQRSATAYTDRPAGSYTEFDALGRVTQVRADSELGTLTTAIEYLAGFQKRVTNPRGYASTTSYQAFDQPTEGSAVTISAPQSLTLSIARDVFGKPTAITRSGAGASATRSYVYDTNQRLCKTIEPETGATLQDYDNADNVAWRATGLSLTSPTCDRGSVAAASKVSFAYDTRNRLTSIAYGDGSPGISRTYTPDGLPKTVSTTGSAPSTWTTSYLNRRLPQKESLSFGGATYDFTWSYDVNGHVNQLTYPDGASVAYSPNALGEPTQVGVYASGVSYHPNGAIAGFTYGNGKVHSLSQNARGLPATSTDAGVISDQYTYDANGNVASITDLQESVTTRTMGYDGLDRLTSANAPGVWGNATYSYDTLDNLTGSTIGSRSNVYSYDQAKNLLTSFSSNVSGYNYTYGYDAQGNITQRGTQGFTFDQGNRMIAATGKATYTYDGLGHRVSMAKADGTNVLQVYTPAGQLLYAKQTGGPNPSKTTRYVYLHQHQIAEINQ